MDLRKRGWSDMGWNDLAQHTDQWRALVNTVMNLRVSQNFAEFLSGCTTGDCSKRAQMHEASSLVTTDISLFSILYSKCLHAE
jgi:hypothetical protein